MRPRGVEAADPEKSKQEGIDERDDRMEAVYSYDRYGERSSLAFVTTYRDELVEEFFSWRRQVAAEGIWTGERIFDAIRRWERTRFGADLYVSAHAVLTFLIRAKLDPSDGGRKLPAGYFDKAPVNRPVPTRVPTKNPEELARKAARGHAMPHVHPSRAQRDEQLMTAERLKREMLADEPTQPGEDRE